MPTPQIGMHQSKLLIAGAVGGLATYHPNAATKGPIPLHRLSLANRNSSEHIQGAEFFPKRVSRATQSDYVLHS
jgi:hypothetical protein